MAYVTLDTGWLTPAQISQASYGVNSPWQNVEKALVNIANDQGVASAYVSGQGFGQTYGMTTDRLEVTGPQPVLNAQADSTVESLQVRLRYRTQSSSARLHWSMEYADASDTFGYFTSFGDLSENADGWVNPTLLLPSTGDSFASIELELFNPTLHPGLRLAADSFKPSSLADPSVGLAVAFAGNQSGSVEIDSIELRMVYHEAGDAPLVSTVDAGTIEALDIGPQIDYAPTSKNILYQSQVSAFTGQRSGSLPRDFDYVDGSPGLQNIARHAAYDGNGNAYVPQGNWDRLFRTAQYGIEYGTPLIPINRLAEVENIGPGEKMNYLFSAFFIETKGSESVLWGLENPHPSYPFTYLPAGGPLALKEDKAFFGEPIGSWNIPDNAELKEIQVKTTLSATKGTWTLDQSLFSATEAYPADAASQSTDVTFDYDLDGVFIKETEQGKLSRFVKQVTHTFPAAAFVDWDTVGYNASGYTNGPGQAWKASGAYASLEQIRTQLSTGNQNPDKNRILVHGLEVTLVWGHLEAEVNAGTVAPEIATLAVTQAFSPSTLDAGTIAPEPAAATLAVSMAATAVAGTIGAEAATLATFDFMVATVDAGTVGPVAAEMLDYRNMETGSGQFGSLELVTATPTFQWSMGSTLDAGSLSSTGLLTMERGDGLTRNSQRFMDLLPPWFSTEAPAVNGLRAGAATVITHVRDVVREARKQMRLSTSSGGYIDLFAADFFGTDLPRRQGEGDASYRTRIR
ncbi:MAG: hypothetical protein P8N94_06565, partial [Gammaproteobacteria bacterium]|nr:hypothetical protein [Gammaproteobacteria bacterium]